jgi:hypothetical protein
MNSKRFVSAIALAAILVAQAAPVQAGRMLCGMKKEAVKAEACSRCDGPAPSASGGVLRARSCCRVVPTEVAESLPVIVVSSARKPSSELAVTFLAAPVPALAMTLGAGLCGPAVPALSRQLPSESPTRTVVLRN